MIDYQLFLIIFVSIFTISYSALHAFIYFGGIGLYVSDNNKGLTMDRKVLTSAGLPVNVVLIFSYLIIGFLYGNFVLFLSISVSLFLGLLVGLYDDYKQTHIWYKVPQMLVVSIPFLYFKPWDAEILGSNIGDYYWFIILPVALMSFPNGFNIIAGYDGLEASISIIMGLFFIFMAIITSNIQILFLTFPMLAVLSAFLLLNWSPSKLIGGNTFSFSFGLLLVIIPMIETFKIVLPFFFGLHLVEFYFKLKYKGKTSIFGNVDEEGYFTSPAEIKSLGHLLPKYFKLNEKGMTLSFSLIQFVFCIIGLFFWIIYSGLYQL